MVRIPSQRAPTHPGEMLIEEFLKPMRLTQREVAKAIRVPYRQINEIANGRRGITTSTALRLARYFGTSPDFWMNLQLRWELYRVTQTEKDQLKAVQKHSPPASDKSHEG
jgi:antitoxin HigA-1